MKGKLTLEIMGSAERAAMLALSTHERLIEKGDTNNAREVWVIYLEAIHSAELMGESLGVEPEVA